MSKESTPNSKKKSTPTIVIVIVAVLGVLFILFVVGTLLSSLDTITTNNVDTNTTQANTNSTEDSTSDVAGIGDAVRDGKFEFVVTKIDCGKSKVGGEFFNETAQGEFCIMDISVKNIGDEPQYFDSNEQKIFNKDGQEFSNDGSAEIAIEGNDVWLNEINPGNKIKGQLVFDVPKGTKIVSAELHDSVFSNGVAVTLE